MDTNGGDNVPVASPPAQTPAPTVEELQTKVIDLEGQVGGLVGVKKSLEDDKSKLEGQVAGLPKLQEDIDQKGAEITRLLEQLKLYDGIDPKVTERVKELENQLQTAQNGLLVANQKQVATEFGLNPDDLKNFTVEQLETVRKAMKLKGAKPSFPPASGAGSQGVDGLTARQKMSMALEELSKK